MVTLRLRITLISRINNIETQDNCLLECRAKTLLTNCSCIPYYYPRSDRYSQLTTKYRRTFITTYYCVKVGYRSASQARVPEPNGLLYVRGEWSPCCHILTPARPQGWKCLMASTEVLEAIHPTLQADTSLG